MPGTVKLSAVLSEPPVGRECFFVLVLDFHGIEVLTHIRGIYMYIYACAIFATGKRSPFAFVYIVTSVKLSPCSTLSPAASLAPSAQVINPHLAGYMSGIIVEV